MTSDPPHAPDALETRALEAFRERFDAEPAALARAPGRVELLGNHTDYNEGFVLSCALDLGVAAAAAPLPGGRTELWSATLEEGAERSLDAPEEAAGHWSAYPLGVLRVLRASGRSVAGARLAFASDLPLGAGVSSSAAMELATAEAALACHGEAVEDRLELARLCQRAEVEEVGVPCGILDMFTSAFGRAGHALFLDCRHLAHEALPLGDGEVGIVVVDSGVQHALVDGAYGELRASCERAAAALGGRLGRDVPALRDVELDTFLAHAHALDPQDRRRAEHVLRENERVLAGREALARGRVDELGRLLSASHASSRDLLGNSCPELDLLVERAATLPGWLGGKLCGGGFGGSTVHLVEAARAAGFAETLAATYERESGRTARAFTARAGDGSRGRRFAG